MPATAFKKTITKFESIHSRSNRVHVGIKLTKIAPSANDTIIKFNFRLTLYRTVPCLTRCINHFLIEGLPSNELVLLRLQHCPEQMYALPCKRLDPSMIQLPMATQKFNCAGTNLCYKISHSCRRLDQTVTHLAITTQRMG